MINKTTKIFLTIFLLLQFMLPIIVTSVTNNVYAQEQIQVEQEKLNDTQSEIASSENNELTETESSLTQEVTSESSHTRETSTQSTSHLPAETEESEKTDQKTSSVQKESESSEEKVKIDEATEELSNASVIISYEIEGIVVEVDGGPGVLPNDATLKVEPVAKEQGNQLLDQISESEDTRFNTYGLFDITIIDKSGKEIQPAGDVQVTFKGLPFTELEEETAVYHVNEQTTEIERFETQVSSEDISFETTHFSIYAVGISDSKLINSAEEPLKLAIGDIIKLDSSTFSSSDWKFSENGIVSMINRGNSLTIKGVKEGKVAVKHEQDFLIWTIKSEDFYIQVMPDTIDEIKLPSPPINDTNAGQVTASKNAKWVDYANRIAEINLNVQGNPKRSGSDIILIMDTSGSMKDNGRMTSAQSASKNFIQTILDNQNKFGNRVAFIPFSYGYESGGASQLEKNAATAGSHNFTDEANKISSYVDKAMVMGGTNYTAALQKAIDFTNSRVGNEKNRPLHIVFMSDGAPGLRGESTNDRNWNGINQANTLKNAGATIQTLGIQVSGQAPLALRNISSTVNGELLYQNVSNVNDLNSVMQAIAGNIHLAGTEATFTDYISDYYNFYSGGAYKSDGTYNSSDRSVKVSVDDITQELKEYKVYVQLKDEYRLMDNTYPTNKDIHLNYKDIDNQSVRKTKNEIGDPSLAVTSGSIAIKYTLVDKDGNYIDKSGQRVDSQNKVFVPNKDAVTYHQVNDSNRLEVYGNPSYQAQANPPLEYQLFSGDTGQRSITLTPSQKHQTVEFKVVFPEPDPIDFIFTKVDENGQNLSGASFTLERIADNGKATRINHSETGAVFKYADLEEGRYRLTENQAPSGYRLPIDNNWEFDIVKQADNTLTIEFDGQDLEIDSNESKQFILKNYPQGAFPKTGGAGIFGFMIVGISIIVISLSIYKKING